MSIEKFLAAYESNADMTTIFMRACEAGKDIRELVELCRWLTNPDNAGKFDGLKAAEKRVREIVG